MTTKQRATENKRKFVANQRKLGLCLDCTNQAKVGRVRCENCLVRMRQTLAQRKQKASQNGLCSVCLHHRTIPKHRLCEDCYYKETSHKHFKTGKYWKSLKDKFIAQEGRCALSGCEIAIGVSAELDHINPSSRGGESELDNVQWVLCVVNRMEDHMTETEFFTLVERLYFTMKGTGND